MLRKRLIYRFLTDGNFFYLSRNFRLQKIGNLEWLVQSFGYKSLIGFVDEICIVNPFGAPLGELRGHMEFFVQNSFTPLSFVGGLKSSAQVRDVISMGFEKVGFNSAIYKDPNLVGEAVSEHGSQSVFAQLDFRDVRAAKEKIAYTQSGREPSGILMESIHLAQSLGVGEIVTHSIDREGTGMGFDKELSAHIGGIRRPLIISGGAGKSGHFLDIFENSSIGGVATSNLLNFMATGIREVRNQISASGFKVANLEPPS